MAIKKLLSCAIAIVAMAGHSVPASAALAEGSRAPYFTTTGALAGETFAFDLGTQLREGPVVIYFFPRAFTQGCTLESNAFAEAMPQFRAACAQVIGLSADDIPTLQRFSREECRDAFPVGRANPQIIEQFDVAFGQGLTNRTSYVIAQDGRIVMVHSDLDWREHVSRTLAAVRALSN